MGIYSRVSLNSLKVPLTMLATNKLHHYARLIRWDKPIGTLLLLWPTLTALWMASRGVPSLSMLVIFSCGVFLMRSAGCILNDLADRDIDAHVARTQQRPLATGALTVKEALQFCLLLFSCAFILILFLNRLTQLLAVIGALLTLIYPFMKRFTHLPQVGLGIAFNWGIPMAFAAQTGHVPAIAWMLFLIASLWTIAYDTQYAMVDRHDDLRIGVKSTAILFGEWDRAILFYLQLFVLALWVILGLSQGRTWPFYAGICACSASFAYQQYLIKDRLPAECFKAFLHNHWAWLCVFVGVLLSA